MRVPVKVRLRFSGLVLKGGKVCGHGRVMLSYALHQLVLSSL